MIVFLLACAPDGPWTEDRAVAPVVARLDADGDGRVTAVEYARVTFSAPAFADADRDRDGALSVAEARRLVEEQDPSTFFRPTLPEPGGLAAPGGAGAPAGTSPTPPDAPGMPPGTSTTPTTAPAPPPTAPGTAPAPGAPPPGTPAPMPERPRVAESLLVLEILAEEVHAARPDLPLPDAERIAAVGKAGSLTSDDARALLGELAAAWDAAGLSFPVELRPKP